MRKLIVMVCTVVLAAITFCSEITTDVYGEFNGQVINKNSIWNKENGLGLNEAKYALKGIVTMKNNFGASVNGVLKLQAEYVQSDYNSANIGEKIFIKEIYIDYENELFNARMGKQFIKWGDGVFFNPCDVINIDRDLLKPVNDAEGRPFMQVSVPIESFASVDILAMPDTGGIKKIRDVPVAVKVSGSLGEVSGFSYVKFSDSEKPVFGADASYVINISQTSDLALYGEGSLKGESSRKYIDEKGEIKEREDKYYYGVNTGIRANIRFPAIKRFDKLTFIGEFYYDNENLSKNEFENLTIYRKSGVYIPFKASKSYLYTGITAANAFLNQMNMTLSTVINSNDRSGIAMVNTSYQYDDSTEMGINTKGYYGDKNSEFGNSLAKAEIGAYTKVSF